LDDVGCESDVELVEDEEEAVVEVEVGGGASEELVVCGVVSSTIDAVTFCNASFAAWYVGVGTLALELVEDEAASEF
jgi:hypothetical protein